MEGKASFPSGLVPRRALVKLWDWLCGEGPELVLDLHKFVPCHIALEDCFVDELALAVHLVRQELCSTEQGR
eukprot:2789692-Amphidinium_carterae.1